MGGGCLPEVCCHANIPGGVRREPVLLQGEDLVQGPTGKTVRRIPRTLGGVNPERHFLSVLLLTFQDYTRSLNYLVNMLRLLVYPSM